MDKLTAGDRIEVKTDAGEKFQALVITVHISGLSGMLRRDGGEVDYTISREVHDPEHEGRWVLNGSENVRLRKL
jgi:hypothetical protein